MSQLFISGSQSTGVSASASVLPMNTQDWSPLGWTGWISLQSKGLSRVFSNTTVQKHQFFGTQPSSQSNSHIHTWPLALALTRWTFVGKVMSLLFNMLSRLVITFLPRSKHLLISWLQSPSAVILKPRKIKSVTVSTVYTKKRQTYYLPTAESIYHHSWSSVAKIISPWKLGPNLPSHQTQLKTGYKITKPFFKTLEISKWTTVISDRQETKWVLCLPQFTT